MNSFVIALTAMLIIACDGHGFKSFNPKTGAGVPGGLVAPGTGSINTNNRDEVGKAYQVEFFSGGADMAFTGNIQNCQAGTTSIEFQQSVINRINFYRAMAGLKPAGLTPNLGSYQQAALIMAANGALDHFPPSNWKCYSQEGASGAGSSNLALGAYGPSAIDLYMDDIGGNNASVGHRRWVLGPGQSTFATGDVPGANSLAVMLGGGGEVPATLEFVAWPSAGYFPKSLIPSSRRWSFSFLKGSLRSDTVVEMKSLTTNQNLIVTKEPSGGGYGGVDAYVWLAPDLRSVSGDFVIEIRVRNLQTSGGIQEITYQTLIFGEG